MDRVEQARSGWFAIMIHLSKLRTHNLQLYQIRVALRSFDTLILSSEAGLQLHTLDDVVVRFNSQKPDDVDWAINRVRKLFQSGRLPNLLNPQSKKNCNFL